jgi:hypothetical protein
MEVEHVYERVIERGTRTQLQSAPSCKTARLQDQTSVAPQPRMITPVN